MDRRPATIDRIPLKTAGEYDALTRWRHVLSFKPGTRSWTKRQYRRRVRRVVRNRLRELLDRQLEVLDE